MALTKQQVDALLAPLHPSRIAKAQGQSHLESWDVRRHLLRAFGWGGWDFTVVSVDCVSERSKWDTDNPLKGRHTVVYRVIGRLTIKDETGRVLAVFEDGATGDAANQPSIGDAHDMALKTAMSQALKRCAINLGDQFGLSLYNNGSPEPVVGRSLPHEATAPVPAAEAVTGGEMTDRAEQDKPAERGPLPSEQDQWQTPPVERVTDARWLEHWRVTTLAAETPGVLRGQLGAARAAYEAGTLTLQDGKDCAALVEERMAEMQQQPGPVQKAQDDLDALREKADA